MGNLLEPGEKVSKSDFVLACLQFFTGIFCTAIAAWYLFALDEYNFFLFAGLASICYITFCVQMHYMHLKDEYILTKPISAIVE